MSQSPVNIDGVDFSHWRLIDLAQLADQAKPFYNWVENQMRLVFDSSLSLDDFLRTAQQSEIEQLIRVCYLPNDHSSLPLLFDGIGRSYPHPKACYYFFAWLIRDAPQQRLSPLIGRLIKTGRYRRVAAEIHALATLIVSYRGIVNTFAWQAVREVIIDRLEGSRRSIKGHEKEAVVRLALLTAIQDFYQRHGGYGNYAQVHLSETQVTIGRESYDVIVNLLNADGHPVRKILVPIKTRETEGGGHAHLFSRDIWVGLETARRDPQYILIVVIIAQNWSPRETENLNTIVNHLIVFPTSPSLFTVFTEQEQLRLNQFIAHILMETPNA
jgi:hypothetical protein